MMSGGIFMRRIAAIFLMGTTLMTAACGTGTGDRAASGAGIGAGVGVAVGAVTGLSILEGAVIGAALSTQQSRGERRAKHLKRAGFCPPSTGSIAATRPLPS